MRIVSPERLIGNSSSAQTGLFASNKSNQEFVAHESSLEKDLMYRLELDHMVDYYVEQPFVIEYIDMEGKSRKYFPDLDEEMDHLFGGPFGGGSGGLGTADGDFAGTGAGRGRSTLVGSGNIDR